MYVQTKSQAELENKSSLLQKEKQELEKTVQKLHKRLEDERERYALLSSQFNELNAKMVEIINNVTNLKLDAIEPVSRLNEPSLWLSY